MEQWRDYSMAYGREVAIDGFGRQHADHVPKLICVNARYLCALFDDRIDGNWFLRPCGYIPPAINSFQSLPLQASA